MNIINKYKLDYILIKPSLYVFFKKDFWIEHYTGLVYLKNNMLYVNEKKFILNQNKFNDLINFAAEIGSNLQFIESFVCTLDNDLTPSYRLFTVEYDTLLDEHKNKINKLDQNSCVFCLGNDEEN